jgi:dipeptide/tripeptide permease
LTASQINTAAGYLQVLLAVPFFLWLLLNKSWTREERQKLYVIVVFFLAAAAFWSVYEQAGSTLNLFADRNTRTEFLGRSFPSSWFQSLNPLYIFIFAPDVRVALDEAWQSPALDANQVRARPAGRRSRIPAPDSGRGSGNGRDTRQRRLAG